MFLPGALFKPMNMQREFDSMKFDSFYDTPVAFFGDRPGARKIALTVKCSVTEDVVTIPGEAIAPTLDRTFDIVFPRSCWPEATPPQIGEWLCFQFAGEELNTRADAVSHMPDGDFVIVATWKHDRKGGPAW